NPKPETRNPEPGTRNPEPETRNLEAETRNPEPGTRNPKPETRNPKPEIRNPKPMLSPLPLARRSVPRRNTCLALNISETVRVLRIEPSTATIHLAATGGFTDTVHLNDLY
ncbi:hypothetical protein T484DRAFT_1629035, partial [Baffinella frigidus]